MFVAYLTISSPLGYAKFKDTHINPQYMRMRRLGTGSDNECQSSSISDLMGTLAPDIGLKIVARLPTAIMLWKEDVCMVYQMALWLALREREHSDEFERVGVVFLGWNLLEGDLDRMRRRMF